MKKINLYVIYNIIYKFMNFTEKNCKEIYSKPSENKVNKFIPNDDSIEKILPNS